MSWVGFGRTAAVTALALAASAGLVMVGQQGSAAQASGGHSGAGDCIAHHPNSDAQYPYCSYPWFALNGTSSPFTYGADHPGTQFEYGQAAQFATATQCGGPFGPDTTYCDTPLSPAP